MEIRRQVRRAAGLAMLSLVGLVMASCGGGGGEPNPPQMAPQQPASQPPVSGGTGTLTITVTDPDGRPVRDARVGVSGRRQIALYSSAHTDSNGSATFGSLPATVDVSVAHDFGYRAQENVNVAQRGITAVGLTLLPGWPQPTLALLPVEIPRGSVNPDRNELTLQVTVVASPTAPFVLAGYGDYSPASTPSLGLELGENANDSRRECYVWLDRRRTAPTCGTTWGTSPYTVSVEQFRYDVAGPGPLPTSALAQSTMLVIDQSGRVSTLDPGAFRSYAARRFIERIIGPGEPKTVSIAGFAGSGGNPATPFSLPSQPLWVPSGTGTVFTANDVILKSNVGVLEPLVGGSAPLFDALEAAVALTAVAAPPGDRTVVALLGGGDDRELTAAERDRALASLRRQRDDTGVRAILIDAAPTMPLAEHREIAGLAAALRAPTISLGAAMDERQFFAKTWASGSLAALDLAADLTKGSHLPTLSAAFRVRANAAGAFPSGAILRGVLYVESDICPMGCSEIPLAFAVEIP